MAKRTVKTLICGALAATFAFGFSACSLEPESAYDIAVKYGGFQGTEQEWLASLNGADGKDAPNVTIEEIYTAWVQREGNEGKSFNEFLREYLTVDYNENNDTEQIAHNLASVVSVYCAFESAQTNEWSVGAGSGVIYSLDKENGVGYVVTNYHVVYESTASDFGNGAGIVDNANMFVYLYGIEGGVYLSEKIGGGFEDTSGKAVKASYVGGSMAYDVAVLKIYGDNLRDSVAEEAKFAENGVTAGEKVYAIGNASGEGISVSAGAISVESEYIRMKAADKKTWVNFHVLRTDSAINPGNSGGGLFNAAGELVGIVNAKSSASSEDETTIENVGYALPAADVRAVVKNITDYAVETGGILQQAGKVYKPYLGVTLQRASAESAWDESGNKLLINETVKVSQVQAGREAGIGVRDFKVGDKILSVRVIAQNGEERVFAKLGRQADFSTALLYARAGDTIAVTVKRNMAEKTLFFSDLQESDFVEADEFAKKNLVRLG